MIAFACPHCRNSLQVDDGLAGKQAACPHCGQTAEVPSPGPPPRPAPDPDSESALGQTVAWKSPDDSQANNAASSSGEIPAEALLLAPAQQSGEIGRLGPYRVLKILGSGGMGVVFQGHDPLLDRPVAIKALLPSIASKPDNRERFLREARTAASLESDYIVPIYQVAEEKGVAYLVMRLLQGETLEARLHRENLPPIADVLRVGREIAEGLAAAHARGLIHRDVKPANVFLESPRGRVRLLDFGLARPESEDSGLTRPGVLMGTPAYMSPEQARGRAVGSRSDLFSLGCVLYQMATGRLPFHGTDILSRLMSLAADDPIPVRDLNAAVPAEVADLVMQLLVKNPDHRFPTARGVVEAIEIIEAAQVPARAAAAPAVREDVLGLGDAKVGFDDAETEAPAAGEAAASVGVQPADWVEELAGGVLGHYQLGREIGRGFHGAVFRAGDLTDRRTVALKVFAPMFPADDAEARRFIAAMKPLLGLRHPHLVPVLRAGRTGPYCWMALGCVEGESLTSRIERLGTGLLKIDWRGALRVAIHVARALEFACARRLTHGNVTPENILCDSASKVVRLNDLMVRRALEGSALQRAVEEEKRQAELPYLSPEQIDGLAGDDISDLYCLGAVVYAVLAGRPPYLGDTPDETARLIRTGKTVRPKKRQRSIPTDFEWAVMTMLARERRYRFQTASDLLVHLERIAMEQGLIL